MTRIKSVLKWSTPASVLGCCIFVLWLPAVVWSQSQIGGGGSGATVGTVSPYSSTFTVSQFCPASAPQCYSVHGDVKVVIDPVFTSTSGTVTSATAAFCGGSGPACSAAQIALGHSTDVGAIEYGVSSCNASNEMACTQYNCAQGTITAVASATSITVSPVCSFNSSVTAKSNTFVWGTDDGTQLAAANTAARLFAQATGPATIQLPCATMLTSVNPFPATVTREYSIGITGQPGCTTIVPLPKMSCNLAAGFGCLADMNFDQITLGDLGLNDKLRDVLFNGFGYPDKDAAATYASQVAFVRGLFFSHLDNVGVQGIAWNRAVGTPVYGVECVGCTATNVLSYAAGNFSCLFLGNASVAASMHGGSCGGSVGNPFLVGASGIGAGDNVAAFGVYFNQPNGTSFTTSSTYSIYNGTSGGLFVDHGSAITAGIWNDTGGTSELYGSKIGGSGNYNLNLAGGVVRFFGAENNVNANFTGGTFYDMGGNDGPTGGTAIFPTGVTLAGSVIRGSLSNTGPCVIANLAITQSGGFGTTAAVTAVSGTSRRCIFTITNSGTTQGANPTVTFTFPLAFITASNLICTAQVIGGNQTLAATNLFYSGTPAATSVVYTYEGTPTVNDTEIVVSTCDIP